MLPKALGTAERGWNAKTEWPSETEFDADFEQFYSIIVAREMPFWEQKGYMFKKRGASNAVH